MQSEKWFRDILKEILVKIDDAIVLNDVSDLRLFISNCNLSNDLKIFFNGYVMENKPYINDLQKLKYMISIQEKIIFFDLSMNSFFHDFINKVSILVMIGAEIDSTQRKKYCNDVFDFIKEYKFDSQSSIVPKFKKTMNDIWSDIVNIHSSTSQIESILFLCDALDMYCQLLSHLMEYKICAII